LVPSRWNLSRIPLLLCISITSTLFCLHQDLNLTYSVWKLMTPMWLWFAYDLICTLHECVVYINRGLCGSLKLRSDFSAKSILALCHLFLFCFCILMCIKTDGGSIMYCHAFIPLFLFCLVNLSLFYPFRNVRQPQLDDFVAVNIVTFILISLRLDKKLLVSWAVAFIPLWIIITLLVALLLYGCLLAVDSLFSKTHDPNISILRRSTLGYTITVLCFLIFMVLLTQTLDNQLVIPLSYVNLPLLSALIAVIMIDFLVPSPESYFSLANCTQMKLELKTIQLRTKSETSDRTREDHSPNH
uniref:G_PROTEIN_RECEP_F1_2 domain-containing protein n=1 Tax=Echinostoma caproni TaxID=27848 RepID=A0A183AG46_9TREM